MGLSFFKDLLMKKMMANSNFSRITWINAVMVASIAVILGWLILDDTAEGLLDTGKLAF